MQAMSGALNGTQDLRWPLYASPTTGAPLHREDDALVAGDERFPLEEELPRFLRFPPVEDAEATAKHERIVALAQEHGWREGLARAWGVESKGYHYVVDDARRGVLELFPARLDSVVLEVGCSLGQLTCALAPRVKFIHALEVVPGQARFAALRARQEGLDNVQVAIGGDDCRLPYKDGAFQAVLFNLVLEWCGSRDPDGQHERMQEQLLSELFRVLAPGGLLQLSTKNRFALRYLLGRGDEHAHGLPFGSALPRRLLGTALRLAGKPPHPGGWLHSHEALRQKLLAAGFASTRSFWATPEIRYPTRFIPTDDLAALADARRDPDFVQAESRRLDQVMRRVPDRLVKHLAQGLLFQATK